MPTENPPAAPPPAGHPLVEAALRGFGLGAATSPASTLPRDRRQADARTVSDSQRWRLLQGFAHVVARKGLAATTIDDATTAAGVSKKTFYKFFSSKEDAFLACYEAVDRLLEILAGTRPPAGDLRETTRWMSSLYLGALAAAPDLTHLFLVEALTAGPRVRIRRAEQFERFVDVVQAALRGARTLDPGIPDHSDEDVLAVIGGINELCVHHLARHPAETLPDLEPSVTAFAWRHLTGPVGS